MRIQSEKSEFRTANQSEIAFKIANRSKYGNLNFVVDYPIWVSIKKTLTGKLAIAGQNVIYCIHFEENVQKPSKTECFQNSAISEVFGRFLLNRSSKSNFDQLAPTYPSKFS